MADGQDLNDLFLDDRSYDIRLYIANVGDRTAEKAVLHLLLPDGSIEMQIAKHWPHKVWHDNQTWERYSIRLDELFFAGDVVRLPLWFIYALDNEPKGRVLYRLVYADDATPNYTDFLEVTANQSQAFMQGTKHGTLARSADILKGTVEFQEYSQLIHRA